MYHKQNQAVIDITVDFSSVRTFRWKRMVCACHRHGLFAMTRTNHTLPTERSNGAEINSIRVYGRPVDSWYGSSITGRRLAAV